MPARSVADKEEVCWAGAGAAARANKNRPGRKERTMARSRLSEIPRARFACLKRERRPGMTVPATQAEEADEKVPELSLSAETLCYIIIKAREFDVKVEPVEPDPGSNPADDGEVRIL